jgi:hypothetical protein
MYLNKANRIAYGYAGDVVSAERAFKPVLDDMLSKKRDPDGIKYLIMSSEVLECNFAGLYCQSRLL